MVQGGDPLSKDPGEARALRHRRAERGEGRGARAEDDAGDRWRPCSVPGRPDSAGAQFFIVLADQPALDGQYTVFGRVVGRHGGRCRRSPRRRWTRRRAGDRARRDPARHDSRHAAARRAVRRPRRRRSLAAYRAVLDTSAGPITIEFFPDKAPEHVRQFLRLARGRRLRRHGVPSRRARLCHSDRRAVDARAAPLTEKQQKLVQNLQPEFNDTKHVKGIVSMARGDDPGSATTSFFICTGDVAGARRSVHGLRPGRRRDGGGRGDRSGAAERAKRRTTTSRDVQNE